MNLCRMIVGVMTVSLAVVVCAETYTWDGGGADNNWSTLTNWNPDTAAPLSASNTTVKLDGIVRIIPVQDIANPFVLNRLEFLNGPAAGGKGAFELNGGPLQFVADGATIPTVKLTREAVCVINNAVNIPADTTLNMEFGTYGVDFKGVISGEGSVDKKTGSGGIGLYNGANSFSGGLTIRATNSDWDKANVYASGAMGTGPVSLYGGSLGTGLTSPGGLIFFGTTTQTNPLSLFLDSPIFVGLPNGGGEAVTLNGPIDLNNCTLYLRGAGAGGIGGAISEGGANALMKSDRGTWTLSGANAFTGRVTIVNGTVKLGATGTLNPLVPVAMACATGWYSVATATLDLNGYNQTVSQLSGSIAQAGFTNIVTSAAAATLTVSQADATAFDGRLTGALSLVKTGTGTLTLTNSLSTTTGDITVSNGTLVVTASSNLGNSTNFLVAGGTLELQTETALSDSASLMIADGGAAQVKVGTNLTETVNRLYLGGAQQPRGIYGASGSGATTIDDVHFSGSGKIRVLLNPPVTPTNYIWDAGAADTNIDSPTNWADDTVPEFNGTSYVFFGSNGVTAVVNTPVSLYGLAFNRDGNFSLANGDGALTLGAGGIDAAAPTATARAYTVAEDVTLFENQTWRVTNATMTVSGRIGDGVETLGFTKTGPGTLVLSGSNTYDGVTSVAHGGIQVAHSNALGTAAGGTVISTVTPSGSSAWLSFYGGITLAEPITVVGGSANGSCLINGAGTNTLSGSIITSGGRFFASSGSRLNITGGVTGPNPFFVINAAGVIAFTTMPLTLGTGLFWTDTGGLTVIGVASNTWGDTMVANGTLRTDVANALPPTTTLKIGGISWAPNGTVDLNGFNQTVTGIQRFEPNPGKLVVTSALPATLTVNLNTAMKYDGQLDGALSLVKGGTGTLILSNALSNTRGNIVVSNGTLVVAAASKLGNSTNITVAVPASGTSTLTLQTSTGLADAATLRIANGGSAKVSLAAGVNETVSWLFFGDKMMRAGTYSAASAAVVDTEHFAGTGVLTVLHDKSGTLIKLH